MNEMKRCQHCKEKRKHELNYCLLCKEEDFNFDRSSLKPIQNVKKYRIPYKWLAAMLIIIPIISIVMFFVNKNQFEEPKIVVEEFYSAIYEDDFERVLAMIDSEGQLYKKLSTDELKSHVEEMNAFYRDEYRADWYDHLMFEIIEREEDSVTIGVKLKKSDEVIESSLYGDMLDIVSLTELQLKKEDGKWQVLLDSA